MKIGRPTLPAAEKRCEKVTMTLTSAEKLRLESIAAKRGLGISVFLRECALNRLVGYEDSCKNSLDADLVNVMTGAAAGIHRIHDVIGRIDDKESREGLSLVLKGIYTILEEVVRERRIS